jgi:hypothetical protein
MLQLLTFLPIFKETGSPCAAGKAFWLLLLLLAEDANNSMRTAQHHQQNSFAAAYLCCSALELSKRADHWHWHALTWPANLKVLN